MRCPYFKKSRASILKRFTFAPMRLLAVLLSLYILVLDVYPCVDHDLGHTGTVQAQMMDTHDQQGDDWAAEACSPFCACSCCGVSVDEHLSFEMAVPVPVVEAWVLPMASGYKDTDALASIWRPPQLTV